jgi:hypothetical protein
MAYLILILLAINLPLGYFLCRWLGLRGFVKISLLGLGQYIGSAFASVLVLFAFGNEADAAMGISGALRSALTGLWIFAPFVLPIVLLYAFLLSRHFGRRPG